MDKKDVEQQLDKIKEAAGSLSGDVLKWAALALLAVAVLYILWKMFGRRRRALPKQVPDLAIDVMALPTVRPPEGGPALYYFNVPVRLAALVLAPAGRVRELPPLNQLNDIIDCIVPGLARVVAAHKTLVRRWPAQLSSKGFAHQFFTHARLPGQGGKGTPWSSAAGLFKIEGQPLMAGLILRAEAPTNLGQRIIEQEAQWLDILRIK